MKAKILFNRLRNASSWPFDCRFFRDTKRYWQYVCYAAKASLKSEVANSYLSWLWWFLDPLLFMLVYTFVAEIVFERGGKGFPAFVIIGLSVWTFFNKCVSQSVSLLRSNREIIKKVYVPKHILLLQNMLINGFKMGISFGLALLFMVVYQIPFTPYIFYCLPHLMMIAVVAFGSGCILMHLGVFVSDLRNVITVVLRLMFYLSGVFYDVQARVPAPANKWLLRSNPAAFAIAGCRDALMYQKAPDWGWLFVWTFFGVLLSGLGLRWIYRYENSYGKVI